MSHLIDQIVPQLLENNFAVMTMHRPSNVDAKETLEPLIDFLTGEVAPNMPLLWPIHPRARKQLELFGLWDKVVKNIKNQAPKMMLVITLTILLFLM